ncbi:TolC family protein [Mucilaginibacter sp. S1162]|uniref:TolC family protein n=1 Tax=Mucilaginibacter humi TaxID=2732510 RepID=A0ABX1VZS8_9SPHI|nr:TolC family protein [Mucilaginibacter humi]NNU33461.1 TolC family protein [Mucilaginibacter humi]
MRFKVLFVIPLLIFTSALKAQGPADTLALTFQGAEKQFLANNLELLAQKYNIDASKALITQAKLWDNPTLSTDQNIYDGGSKKFFYHNSNLGQVFVQLSRCLLPPANGVNRYR